MSCNRQAQSNDQSAVEETSAQASSGRIAFPGTDDPHSAWQLYNQLIEGIPGGACVTDYCLGTNWSYLQAECGMGVSYTCKGGAPRMFKQDLRGKQLREVAQLAKSWNFAEATLGTAALNAWYGRAELLDPLGAVYDEPVELPDGTIRKMDAFELQRPRVEAAGAAGGRRQNVVVVGHFPHVDRIREYANLTVLERNCTRPDDTPDPACEYVMPQADFAFITGVTIINKTAPRLLALAQRAKTTMVGPSVVMSPLLFEHGVDMLAGSVVGDPEKTRFAVKNGAGQLFGEAIQMMSLARP